MSKQYVEPMKEEFLKIEFQEAMAHCRYIVTTRTQYLAFFFTLMLALLGFSVSIFEKQVGKFSLASLLGMFSLIWVLDILTILLYISVKKMGFIYNYYEYNINQIRKYFYIHDRIFSNTMDIEFLNSVFINKRWFSIQKAAEIIFFGFAILFIAADLFIFFEVLNIYNSSIHILSLLSIMLLIMLIVIICIRYASHRVENDLNKNDIHVEEKT